MAALILYSHSNAYTTVKVMSVLALFVIFTGIF